MPTPTINKNNLGTILKELRQRLHLSQEAIGAQGFCSAPGWIKIENGQRQASEKLIERFCAWLVKERHMTATIAAHQKELLLTAKYLDARSVFVRDLAITHARKDARLSDLLAPRAAVAPKRGRPAGSGLRR